MKKLLFVIVLLLAFLLVSCEKEEAYTPEGWAMWAVKNGYDNTEELITPYIINVQEAICVFEEDINDGEQNEGKYACFIVSVQQELNGNATERKFAVFVGWEDSIAKAFLWIIQSRFVTESNIKDIDVVEIEE